MSRFQPNLTKGGMKFWKI